MSRNTASLLVARVVAQLLAIALTVVLAARIGLAGFGEYAFVSAIVFIGNVVTTFGTDLGTVSTEFEPHGDERLGRQSQTWLRIDGTWRIVAAHVSWRADPA